MLVGLAALVETFAPQVLIFADLLLLAFFVFASVSIWRCAPNSSWVGWGYMARVVVVLSGLLVIMLVFGAFVSGEI